MAGLTTLPKSFFNMKHKKFELKTRKTTIASYNATYDGYLQFCDDMGKELRKRIVKIILNGWILPKVKAAFMLIENVCG